MPYEPLTKARIVRALNRLGELAQAEGLLLEVALYGGAVFTVVYESRVATKDVDAIVRPSEAGRRLARRVTWELDLPEDWLNDDVRQFLAAKEARRRLTGGEFGPGVVVSVPTAEYLLALKVNACRAPLPGYAGDQEDLLFLLKKMGLKSLAEVEAIYARFFPHDVLPEVNRTVVAALLKKARAS